MDDSAASAAPPRRRYLFWSVLTFMALLFVAAATLPWLLSGGRYLEDPAFWAALAGFPALAWVLHTQNQGRDDVAREAFVAIVMAVAWVFTVLIQGSGYLVGNYAYLSVVVLFSAFFLSARATAIYAGLNIGGVILIHTASALAITDLVLSLTYLVIFSTLLILIAGLFERDAASLEQAHQRMAAVSHERQQILEETGDAILRIDADGRLVQCNQNAQELAKRLLGGPLHLGEVATSALPIAWRGAANEIRDWAAQQGRLQKEIDLPDDGSSQRFLIRGVRSLDGEGTTFFIRDITIQHQQQLAEDRRREEEAEIQNLEHLNGLQRDFINMASHELQTPLTPLRLQLGMLRRAETGPLNERQLASVAVLDRNVMRMSRLVEDILEVVRAENHRLSVELGDTELVTLCKEAIEHILPLCAARDISMLFEGPEEAWAQADASRVEQILGNLLGNAVKFCDDGGQIRIVLNQDDASWVIQVSDTGIGFDMEDQARLFKPFSQLHGHTPQFGGTGLGLAISKGIAEAMGGAISGHSDGHGKGASFTVRLLAVRPGGAVPNVPEPHHKDHP